MKSIFSMLLFAVCMIIGWSDPLFATKEEVYASLDSFKAPLKRFRTTQHDLQSDTINLDGLKELPVSGGSQFSQEELSEILKHLPSSSILIVDLRQESHGFINGKPVSWVKGRYNNANRDKTLIEIENDEQSKLTQALKDGQIAVTSKIEPANQLLSVEKIQTEKEYVESKGLKYLRLPVTDHDRPSDQIVDEFVQVVRASPAAWIHFHCRGGSGRTTTFLNLYDMMFNARTISFEDILARQALIGGKDLTLLESSNYKRELMMKRLEFLKNFYEYCKQVPDFSITWSQWIATQSQ